LTITRNAMPRTTAPVSEANPSATATNSRLLNPGLTGTDSRRQATAMTMVRQLQPGAVRRWPCRYGPAAGLNLADQFVDVPALRGYHLLPSVRGDLLDQLGRHDEARTEVVRAAAMTQNNRECTLLLARAAG
jgi:hypothetical protein